MDVGDTGHGDEGYVVQYPTDCRVDAGVVDMVDLVLLEIVVPTLPAHQIPGY